MADEGVGEVLSRLATKSVDGIVRSRPYYLRRE